MLLQKLLSFRASVPSHCVNLWSLVKISDLRSNFNLVLSFLSVINIELLFIFQGLFSNASLCSDPHSCLSAFLSRMDVMANLSKMYSATPIYFTAPHIPDLGQVV